jgi:hypothetical protein
MTRIRTLFLLVAASVSLAAAAQASPAGPEAGLFQPSVPVSAFSRPAFWFDPSRLQISTEVAVGGVSGAGAQGLQTTRLSYRIGNPLSMSVSLGNAFGGRSPQANGFFLEGFDLQYRPLPSMLVQFRYVDLRSPLQLQRSYDYWR